VLRSVGVDVDLILLNAVKAGLQGLFVQALPLELRQALQRGQEVVHGLTQRDTP